jgi:iron(III) transport system permease protein
VTGPSLTTPPTAAPGRPVGSATLGTAGLLAVISLIPLGYVGWSFVSTGPARAATLLIRPRVAELLLNTVSLVLVTVPACVLIGVGAAWLVERTDVPGRALWRPLLVTPLAVPAFVNSYAWVSVLPSLHGFGAAVLVTTLSYFPFVYLPAVAALRRLDPGLEESARTLGSGPAAVFTRVVLPQLRLAILGGALLIGVHLLAEYGAFAMLRFNTFTTAIVDQFQSTFDGAAGSMLAGVLVMLCLLLLAAEIAARGRGRFARIGSGTPRPGPPIRLGRFRTPALLALVALSVLALGIPAGTLTRWLWIGGVEVWPVVDIGSALAQTATLATLGALAATALAYPVAWVAVRHHGLAGRLIEGANFVTSSLPGIVTALALITVALRVTPPLYQTVALLLCAYVLMFIPRAMVSVRAGLAQVPTGLEDASRSLGASPASTFARVTLRLTAPAAAAGAALVFVGVATELTATLLLAPTGTRTLAMRFWSLAGELDYAAAAPYAAIMVVLTLPVTILLFTQATRSATAP